MVRPPNQVARSVSEIIRIDAVGINLEDGTCHATTSAAPLA